MGGWGGGVAPNDGVTAIMGSEMTKKSHSDPKNTILGQFGCKGRALAMPTANSTEAALGFGHLWVLGGGWNQTMGSPMAPWGPNAPIVPS